MLSRYSLMFVPIPNQSRFIFTQVPECSHVIFDCKFCQYFNTSFENPYLTGRRGGGGTYLRVPYPLLMDQLASSVSIRCLHVRVVPT